MKTYKAYGIVVSDEVRAVYLEKFFAEENLKYFKHLGKALIVEFSVTPEELNKLHRALQDT